MLGRCGFAAPLCSSTPRPLRRTPPQLVSHNAAADRIAHSCEKNRNATILFSVLLRWTRCWQSPKDGSGASIVAREPGLTPIR